jgi:DHA2 family multidrug resistance protein
VDTTASFRWLMWARVYQASGIAFLFVPITTVAYVGLPPGKNNDASAMVNLMRNLGGSFGISLAQTMLARRQQFHQLRLVEHLTPYDAPYRQALRHLGGTLTGTAVLGPNLQPHAALYATVQRQTEMMAYVDIFHVLAWAALLLVPLVFLLGRTKPGETAAGH